MPNENQPIGPGARVQWIHGEIRVLAVAEGYAMVRYSGQKPFVVSVMELWPEQRTMLDDLARVALKGLEEDMRLRERFGDED